MKGVTKKINKELEKESRKAKEAKIEAFVKDKLTRMKVLKANIETQQVEIKKITESLFKIEEENYEEIDFNPVFTLNFSGNMYNSLNYNNTGVLMHNNKG